MKPFDEIIISTKLLDAFFHSHSPFDIVLYKFFRANRWLGSKDRRKIAELCYSVFRKLEILKLYTEGVSTNFGKYFLMVFLKIESKMSDQKIIDIFYQQNKDLWKFTDFDARFLNRLNTPLELSQHVRLNYPIWLDPYFKRVFPPEDFEKEMAALNEEAKVDLRVNSLKSTRSEVEKMLLKSEFLVEHTKFSPLGLRVLNGRVGRHDPVLRSGFAEVQDEGSQLVARVCNPAPTDMVVDLCAGAGGKTLALAASMNNRGRIIALDTNVIRLQKAKIRLRRAGTSNVICQELTNKWLKRHGECADVVLVDAPCSGTGTWRRNPDMRSRINEVGLEELRQLQQKILGIAQQVVRGGGRLIYATCSVLMEENEDQIAAFLKNFPVFRLDNIHLDDLGIISSGDGYLRLSPAKHGTDGFFAAVLRKTCSAPNYRPVCEDQPPPIIPEINDPEDIDHGEII
ncbi:MAG: RsmB/NOP family class I SAM-dependent RNA methyltransferase [Holosporaceae bacterium]|jgi:16S rRNA (cytosine967-C5)-methyltransferase|nr:RsmB/NOP family class I SAM-dependent RNA methyltransferase [Holosporaceae bacterium]